MATSAEWNRWTAAQAKRLNAEALGIDSLIDTELDPGECGSWDDAVEREVARWDARDGA